MMSAATGAIFDLALSDVTRRYTFAVTSPVPNRH
jgi:hypothetical protein